MGWPKWDYFGDLTKIRQWIAEGKTHNWIAAQLGVSRALITKICRVKKLKVRPPGPRHKYSYPEKKIARLIAKQKTYIEIGKILGIPPGSVKHFCRKQNMLSQSELIGQSNPNWKGGRPLDGKGYVLLYLPNYPGKKTRKMYVLEHRYVMEQHLGRFLQKNEEVHHIDGDKQNNRIENLQLFANSAEHRKTAHSDQHPTQEAITAAGLSHERRAAARRGLSLIEYRHQRDCQHG